MLENIWETFDNLLIKGIELKISRNLMVLKFVQEKLFEVRRKLAKKSLTDEMGSRGTGQNLILASAHRGIENCNSKNGQSTNLGVSS